MEQLILEIKTQIYDTFILCKNYLGNLDLKVVGVSIVLFYFLLMRKWEAKKTFSFTFLALLLFVILVRLENSLLLKFGAEGSHMGIGVSRIVFFVIIAIIYIYQVALKD
ncbi:MAG: hypothetical protein ABIC68_00105 [Candidatus Omnitrophota bacterium]